MKDRSKAALAHRVRATKEDEFSQEGRPTTYRQVVNYLFATYATDDVIAEAVTDIQSLKQLEGMSAEPHSEGVWEKALWYSWV